MADATVYGVIDQAYNSTKITAAGATSKQTGFGAVWNGSLIGFKGSEDLGSGMKAFFQQEIGLSTDSEDRTGALVAGPNTIGGTATGPLNGLTNRNSFVGLSGGFGAVQIGRQYNFAFLYAIANDPLGFSGVGGYAVGFGGPGGANRTSNMLAYTAPTLAPGLGIQVGKAFGETVTTAAAPTKTGDSTSYGVSYAAGALYAGITGETVVATATTKTKHSTTTITYDLGMAKVGYGLGKTATGTDYNKGNSFSVTVPVGALTLAFSSGDQKAVTAGAAEVKTKISQYGAHYSLSKRTTGYLQSGKQSTTTTSQNIYAVGIKHDF
jgi:predicted porin